MSLFGKLGNFWKRFSTRRTNDRARRRRLFMEPLEGRRLMAVDLFVQKSGDGFVQAGNLVTYNITVTNNGTDDASNVVLSDLLPANTNFNAFNGDSQDASGNNLIYNVPNANSTGTASVTIPRLPGTDSVTNNGESPTKTFTLLLNVNTNAAQNTSSLSNAASATSDFNEAAAGTNDDNTSPTVQTVVGASADLSITKDAPAGTIMAGNDVTFTINVFNAGPSDSQNVVVTDVLPAGLLFQSVNLSGATGWSRTDSTQVGANGTITFSKTSMAAPQSLSDASGSTAVILITATVDPNASSGPLSNPVTVASSTTPDPVTPNMAEATITVQGTPRPDVVVSKVVTGGATNVVAGTELSYTLTVTNQGDAAATGITLRDVVPTKTTYVSFGVPNADWTLQLEPDVGGAGDVVANNPTGLAAGASAVFTFVVRVNASATGNIQNQAMLDDVTGETNTGNNDSLIVSTPTRREAALTITKTDDSGGNTARPGDPIIYTITVANPTAGGGPSDVTGIRISDIFDTTRLSNISYTSVASDGASGNSESASATNINDTNVGLPIGSMIVYTVLATINSSATGNLVNTASLIAPAGTTNTGTVSATDTDMLVAEADLEITKTTTDTSVVAGNNITYLITITNRGVSDATSTSFVDTVPAGTTFESFTQNTGAAWSLFSQPSQGGTGLIVYSVSQLAAGASATFTLVVKTNAGTEGTTVINTIDVGSDTPDPSPDPHPNTASASTNIQTPPAPDLIVTKTDSPDPVIAGQTGQGTTTGFLTYTIRVTNQGTGAANQVVLTDVMPTASTGVQPTFVSFTAPSGWTVNSVPAVGAATGTIQVTSNNNATDNLDPQEFAVFTFVVRVPPTATNGAVITNTATVAAGLLTPESDTANNSSGPTTTTVNTSANLSINKTGPSQPVIVGSLISYTITISSVGPSNASSVTITDVIPAGTTFQSMTANTGTTGWTIEAPNAIHPSSVIASNPTLIPGATGTFTLIVRTNSNLTDGFIVSNTATIGASTTDPVPGNNTAGPVNTTVRVPLDFGDAPDSYGTLLASLGPRHAQSLTSSLRLGATIDTELDGQPNPGGLGDDQNGTSVDDEDGVVLPASLIVGRGGAAIVNSTGTGFLNAWLDFNDDGDFLDDGEQIAFDQSVFAGPNPVPFNVPAGAVTGGTFARFRLNSTGSLASTGPATDGEVEDYGVSIITVNPGTTEILPDPENPGFNMLSINGTPNADTVSVKQLRTHLLQVQTTFNGKLSPKYSMADFRRVVFYGGAGDDTFTMGLARPTSLHGEAGNDRLTGGGGYDEIFGGPDNDTLSGGNGNDVLVGGAGVDSLSGGGGRDILIGGLGADSLNGGSDDDILIGGTTDFDNNHAALSAIMAEWSASDTFTTRVNKLSTIVNNSIHDDFAKDKMTGGAGSDWHLNYLLDTISGFIPKSEKKRL